MPFTTRILVVANRTVDAPSLLSVLDQRAASGPLSVTLLVPARRAEREQAQARADRAALCLHAGGIAAVTILGPEDPVVAVEEIYENRRFDEIVVSTLEAGMSPWLAAGLPERIRRQTDAIVQHVSVPRAEVEPPVAREQATAQPRRALFEGVLGLLRVDTNRVGHPQG